MDIGQGDSALAILPGGVKILFDGGPDKSLLNDLGKILPATDRRIDLVILSHPQADHFTGFISLLDRYEVSYFIWNGRQGETESWKSLASALKEKHVNTLRLMEGDGIKYRESEIKFLSPDETELGDTELNNTVLAAELFSGGVKTLFIGDIGFDVERRLAGKYDMNIDILKVAHHGSKYSSGDEFLAEATPAVSVIQVGKNTYGHPTKDALDRLAAIGSAIYRNDLAGTVHIEADEGRLNIFKER
ncbi:MAG TPA: MBL fold metallo-hydrolase [Candidatus Paceibacterota bacterium]|nr:MBL fold metallo-hydrolase [Candidatus Paceibacterota bacterium]